ncbi:MAG: hypothetical protein HYY05_07715 [Chloroflexi bacterium]|nr:hypothetical protein [Chloroflexota bacterium]
MQRIREAGGWSTPLQWRPCTECGQLLASSRVWRRTAHKACERARVVRKARERRLQRPGQSTPYVHAWRQRNPEDNALLREQEKAKRRERWPDLPEELRNAMLARAHAADQRDYPLTLEEANRSGDRWTEEEDGTILARLRDPARDVALALGRTLWAVRNRRVRLRRTLELQVSAAR